MVSSLLAATGLSGRFISIGKRTIRRRIPDILAVVYSLSVGLTFLVGGLVKFSSTSVGFS